jgi:hypothetical protein
MITKTLTYFTASDEYDEVPDKATILLSDKELKSIKKAIDLLEDEKDFDAIIIGISDYEVESDFSVENGRLLVNRYDIYFRCDNKYSGTVYESLIEDLLGDVKYNVFNI